VREVAAYIVSHAQLDDQTIAQLRAYLDGPTALQPTPCQRGTI
jgi:hypothetical protein